MRLEQSLDRRDLLRKTGLAASALILPVGAIAMNRDRKVEAAYIPNEETKPFVSTKFPNRHYNGDVPVDWVYQAGLDYEDDKADLFLGQIPVDFQTTMWVNAPPTSEGPTVESYFASSLAKTASLQQEQFDKTGLGEGSLDRATGKLFKDMDNPDDYLIAFPDGLKDGWAVWANIPVNGNEAYHLLKVGVLKGNVPLQFNIMDDIVDPNARSDEEWKFTKFLKSIRFID